MSNEPSAIDQHVSEAMRLRRKELGLRQEVLAHTLGISQQQLDKYEKGKNRISAGRLARAAAVLQRPVGFFFPENIAVLWVEKRDQKARYRAELEATLLDLERLHRRILKYALPDVARPIEKAIDEIRRNLPSEETDW